MAEPLTPQQIANFRESIRLHGEGAKTVQLPFATFVQFLDAAERAAKLEAENERLRDALRDIAGTTEGCGCMPICRCWDIAAANKDTIFEMAGVARAAIAKGGAS